MGGPDPRLAKVDLLTRAMRREIGAADPAAPTGWPELPDVAAMVRHVGFVHRWVVAVLRTREAVPDEAIEVHPGRDPAAWFDDGRRALLTALAEVAPEEPCWVIGHGRAVAGFWRRRMVVENAKHLIDLRAAGGGRWAPAPELTPEDCADGLDELFEVMLPRTRPTLAPLPAAVLLRATDLDRVWRVGADWVVDGRIRTDESASVSAGAAHLALALWQRADLTDPDRFSVEGDSSVVAALQAAPVHPW